MGKPCPRSWHVRRTAGQTIDRGLAPFRHFLTACFGAPPLAARAARSPSGPPRHHPRYFHAGPPGATLGCYKASLPGLVTYW